MPTSSSCPCPDASSEDLFVALTNYADAQRRLLQSLSSAHISSTEASMYLNNTYYSDLTYSRVPHWLVNGGYDDNADTLEEVIPPFGGKGAGSSNNNGAEAKSPTSQSTEDDDPSLVTFPAIVKMKFKGFTDCQVEGEATGDSETKEGNQKKTEEEEEHEEGFPWELSISAASPSSSSSTNTELAGRSLSARQREDLLKKNDPRCWFSTTPPRILTETQQQWRNVLKQAMDMMRCQQAAVAELNKFEEKCDSS